MVEDTIFETEEATAEPNWLIASDWLRVRVRVSYIHIVHSDPQPPSVMPNKWKTSLTTTGVA